MAFGVADALVPALIYFGYKWWKGKGATSPTKAPWPEDGKKSAAAASPSMKGYDAEYDAKKAEALKRGDKPAAAAVDMEREMNRERDKAYAKKKDAAVKRKDKPAADAVDIEREMNK